MDTEAQEWKKMYEEAIAERDRESELRLAESEKNARDMTKWSDLAASLKEENEKLKENYRNPVEQWLGATDLDRDYIQKCIDDAVAENKKLKEQFEILNDFCGGIPDNDGQAIVDWICSFMVYEDENEKLKEKLTSIQNAIKDVL